MNRRTRARALLLRVTAAAALLGCGDATGPAKRPPDGIRGLPELQPDVVHTGTVAAGATASFVVAAPVDVPLRVFVQATGGSAADTVRVALMEYESPGYVWSTATSVGSDTSLDDRATSEFRLRTEEHVVVTVTGGSPVGSAAYRVVVRATDPRPERLAPATAIGDTITGEAIDRYGDVDEFTFEGRAGQEVITFFQPLPDVAGGPLMLELLTPGGATLRSLITNGRAGDLSAVGTDRVVLPADGTYEVRVSGFGNMGYTGPSRGPYRLVVQEVRRAPEQRGVRFAIGDTVSESIAGPGDIDEFVVAGTAGTEVELTARLVDGFAPRPPGGSGEALTVELLRGESVLARVAASVPQSSLNELTGDRVVLPATGDYVVRVTGLPVAPVASAAGDYRFELYRVRRSPETHSAALALDDTVRDEAIERHGDVDEFTFPAEAGQHLIVYLTAPRNALQVELFDPAGSRVNLGASDEPSAASPYAPNDGTQRIIAPATGTYRVRVSGVANAPIYPLSYVLEPHAVNIAPEHVPASVPKAVAVTGESIDRRGDVDTYHFDGAPGQLVNIFLRNASGQPAVPGLFLILDRGYPFTFVGASTGRFALPESGSITFSVYGDLNGQSGSGVGPYELEVFPIDSAPEVVSRTYVVGDTISGERLDPAGDLDEYVTTLTAGDHLRFVCEAEEAGQPQWAWCVFSGAPPGVTVYGVGANRSDPATGDFVVPVTGTYHVLIDGNGATSYRFGLVRLP